MTTLTRKVHFTTRARRKRIVDGPEPAPTAPAGRIPRISKLMALAIRFETLINEGTVRDMSELARLAQVTQPRMTQIMNLLHLAPSIQEEILHLEPVMDGRDPITEREVRPIVAVVSWNDQERAWMELRRDS